jgi:hypothetical protein
MAMTMIEAGTRVKKGYYFSARTWMLQPMERDGEPLPGKFGEKYLAIPLLLAFVLAPMMGAAFLMFLPVIGFYLALHALTRPVARLFTRSATEIAATMQPGWQPGEAHLTGKRTEDAGEGKEHAAQAELEQLQKEIEGKRQK